MQTQLHGPCEQAAFRMIQSNLSILQMWETEAQDGGGLK